MSKTLKEEETVFAVPCSRAFVVAPEKVQEFKNHKPNPDVIKRNKEMAKKIKINNLTEIVESKKRIRTKR